jgi:transcriptional regulator with XRE-family HTH domain
MPVTPSEGLVALHVHTLSPVRRSVGVPPHGSPTVRRRQLGQELRRLRERAGMTGDEVGSRLGWSAAKLSRIETAKVAPKRPDLDALLDVYGVVGAQRQRLLSLHRDAARKGWWEDFADFLPQEYTVFLGLEEEADIARNWEPQVVPGLLQTQAYAWEVVRESQRSTTVPPRGIQVRVAARLARQEAVFGRAQPLTIWVVIDESVLLRRFGKAAVMREQLDHLIDISRRPNVRLQVLPLGGAHPVNTGSFIHLRLADFNDVVYLESLYSARFVEDEEMAFGYEMAFDALQSAALGTDASRDLITEINQRWS